MALALFAGEDYEEVAARLTETLASWGCWDRSWAVPASGGITQARKRLGSEPLELLFAKVAVPLTRPFPPDQQERLITDVMADTSPARATQPPPPSSGLSAGDQRGPP